MWKPRFTRLAPALITYLFIGAAVAVLLAGAIALQVDVFKANSLSASAFDGRGTWTVTTWERWGVSTVNSVRRTRWAWSVIQVVGPPDTRGHGDIQTAWAQASPDDPGEWLEVIYAQAVVPSELRVHETYNPGAIVRVTVFNDAGEEVEAWKGIDPSPRDQKAHVSNIPLDVSVTTKRVRIYLDSVGVRGWNEIDAVALVDKDGKSQWAMDARANTAYSGGRLDAGTAAVSKLVPKWSGVDKPMPQFASAAAEAEDRYAAAYGWPWRALAGHASQLTPSGSGPVVGGGTMPPSALLKPRGGGGAAGAALSPPFPRQILWKGLGANAVVFACIVFALRWALVRPYRFLVEASRIRRGCCLKCGYNLLYDFVPGCPECGWRREEL